jgi:hypothetical protein
MRSLLQYLDRIGPGGGRLLLRASTGRLEGWVLHWGGELEIAGQPQHGGCSNVGLIYTGMV